MSFDDTEVDLLLFERLFDLLGIARDQADFDVGITPMESGQDRRDDIRRGRHAAAQEEPAALTPGQAAHIEFNVAVYGEEFFGVLQQPRACIRQADAGPVSFEQFDLELLLQLLDMPGDGGLGDE